MKYEKYEGKSMPSLSDQQRQLLLLQEYGLVTWDISVEVGTRGFVTDLSRQKPN